MMTSTTKQDWQCDKKLRECMATMLEKEIMYDVTFLMGEEGHVVNAHKYVLVSRSPVFQAMLDGAMAERGKIKITDIDKETFQLFLRYLYTDDVSLTEEDVIEVMYVSKKYCVDLLTRKCKEFLRMNISVYNACLLMDIVHEPIDEEIHRNCLQKIRENLEFCLLSPWFDSVGRRCVQAISKIEDVSITEEFLFGQMMKWCDAECERQEMEASLDNKRKVLGDILYNIRFSLMNATYFEKEIAMTSLLTSEETRLALETKYDSNVTQFNNKNRCEYVRLVRFPSTLDIPWSASKDAILVKVSGQCYLHGILVYGCYDTPCKYYVDVMVKEGESRILTEFSTTIESIPEIIMHEIKFGPLFLTGKVYTVEIKMKGSPTRAGSNGRRTVAFGNILQVQFFYANNCELGTNQVYGQIPGLLLRECKRYRHQYLSLLHGSRYGIQYLYGN